MLKILISIVIIILVFLIRKALIPLAVGITLAYLLNPLVSLLQNKLKCGRLTATLLSYLIVIISILTIILGFANIISGSEENNSLQSAINTLKTYYETYQGTIDGLLGMNIEQFNLDAMIKKAGKSLLNVLIGMVAGVYLLYDKDYFLSLCNKAMHLLFPQKVHGVLREILFDINDVLYAFIKGVTIDSVIVALLSSVALTLIGVDYGVFIGTFAGIANIIPYFGPIIGVVPAVLAALAEGSKLKALLAAAALFTIQQVECNFIYPKIIGNSTGIHPLFVLVSVSVAGYFGGILWMILAVPIAGIIKVLIETWSLWQ